MTLQDVQEQAEIVREYVALVRGWHQRRPRVPKKRDVVCVLERRTGSGTVRRGVWYFPHMGGRP